MSYDFSEEAFTHLNESLVGYETHIPVSRFIVDAQLPVTIANFLKYKGHDAIHTSELPNGNATTDTEIKKITINENRILITKDDDFLQSYLLFKAPPKLLLIRTGNISNKDLHLIFHNGITVICRLFTKHSLIEITRGEIITHD